ncbi:MAG: hypothetical protein BRC47_10000 [Cyanobacteria bacterium QS_7_48_42]|nr:MAG: hypothetical protein BRC47_10000 [Cyanobacteria bacterium QS_7_48_42]
MMLLKGEIRRSGDEGKEDAPDTGSKRQRSREAGEKEDAGTRGRADAGSCGTHRSPHGDLKGSREP